MEEATFVTLNWKKCSPARYVSGVKYGRTPKGAIRGGNGSFIVVDQPAELYVVVRTEDRAVTSHNIISVVRSITGWEKITQHRVNMLSDFLSSCIFDVDEGDNITNLEDIFNEFAWRYVD